MFAKAKKVLISKMYQKLQFGQMPKYKMAYLNIKIVSKNLKFRFTISRYPDFREILINMPLCI